MPNTKVLKILLFVLIFFNFFAGGFELSKESKEFDLQKYFVVSGLREKLEQNENWFSSFLSVVLVPFLVIDFLLSLLVIIGVGISILPSIINVILILPLGIIIIFDYVLPMIRGN